MRYQSTTVRLAPPLRSRCDGDHKNALFCRVLQKISACMTTKPVACSQERSPRRLWAKSALPPDATNRSDLAGGFVLSLLHSSSSSTLLAASSSLLGKVTCATPDRGTISLTIENRRFVVHRRFTGCNSCRSRASPPGTILFWGRL